MKSTNNFGEHLSRALAGPLRGSGAKAGGVFTQKISTDIADDIYGTGKAFLDRYTDFEKRYQSALNTHLDPSKVAGVDIDFLRSGGSINLNVLEANIGNEFRRVYTEDILRIPKIFQKHGAPGIQLPSSNLYRLSTKYATETAERIS